MFSENRGQLEIKVDKYITIAIDRVGLFPGKNFRIWTPYLHCLDRYNNYLRQPWHTDEKLKDDNLALRKMFGGVQNSLGTLPEIFYGLNTHEICLMEIGIYTRKYVHEGDVFKNPPPGNIHKEPFRIRMGPRLLEESRLKAEGRLDGSLYDIVNHLLTATGVEPIYNKYKKGWSKLAQIENPSKYVRMLKRLNPYDPETLEERMRYIENKFPEAVEKFKEVLAEPFIPERRVKMDKYGDADKIENTGGFITPGRTYRKGISGRSFWNLREYGTQVWDYFHDKYQEFEKTVLSQMKDVKQQI